MDKRLALTGQEGAGPGPYVVPAIELPCKKSTPASAFAIDSPCPRRPPRMEGAAGLGQVFKRRTGYGASDSAVSVASIESHGLGEGGPKEIIFEFNQVPVP